MKSKVCGITNAEDALLCAESGADFLGFIFYAKSKRYVDAEIAADIVKLLPAGTLKVGVFVNAPADKINAIAEKLKLDYVQLSGDESPDYARTLNTPVIKAFRVGESFDYSVIEKYYGVIPLLDTFAEGAYGGTGKVFSWDTIPSDLRTGIILSGGISVDNVTAAYRQIGPMAVDISSSLELFPGKKDADKVKVFFSRINELRQGTAQP